MSSPLTFEVLHEAVAGKAAAFRTRTRLQPAGGPGEKIFPPTFAGAVYAFEQRRIPGHDDPVFCVVLDTVQSQANRMEAALLEAWEEDRIPLPVVAVDFPDDGLIDRVGRITSLEAPHRIADAIFRDSEFEGTPFRKSGPGEDLDSASARNATPLYRLCPTALVWGLWDSTGPKGGLGAKFERAIASEIVGIGVPPMEDLEGQKNRGLRRDPMNISRNVMVRGSSDDWSVVDDGKTKGAHRPSEINHSNVPFDSDNGGLTVEYAEQTTTISLIALRRLRFPSGHHDGESVNDNARTTLAALALAGATLAFEEGFDLRSRCVLWPETPLVWELLERPGQEPEQYELDADGAARLLNEAVEAAAEAGLEWRDEPLVLDPSEQLVELVRKSQEQLASSGAEE